MSRIISFLLVITAVLLAENCVSAADLETGDDIFEVKYAGNNEETVDFQLLENVGKRNSLIYAFSDDCVPKGSFCHYPYGAYYTCCENTGCFCNRLGFCTCKSYDATSETN